MALDVVVLGDRRPLMASRQLRGHLAERNRQPRGSMVTYHSPTWKTLTWLPSASSSLLWTNAQIFPSSSPMSDSWLRLKRRISSAGSSPRKKGILKIAPSSSSPGSRTRRATGTGPRARSSSCGTWWQAVPTPVGIGHHPNGSEPGSPGSTRAGHDEGARVYETTGNTGNWREAEFCGHCDCTRSGRRAHLFQYAHERAHAAASVIAEP